MSLSRLCRTLRAARPLVLVAALLGSSVAMAAQPGPDGNRGHLNRLLHDPLLMQHLGLSSAQAEKARQLSNQVVESHRMDFERSLRPDTKAERVPLVARVFASVNRDTFTALEDVLSAAQLERLRQIEIQTFGIRALVRPSTIEELELDPSQEKALRDIGNRAGSQLSQLHRSQNMEPADRARQAREIQQAAMGIAREFLTEEQWLRWELLVGAEFRRNL